MPEKVTRSWTGEYGLQYTRKWRLSPQELNELWMRMAGVTRSSIIRKILMPAMGPVLELGCNCGNQLAMLHETFGFKQRELYGIDLVPEAVAEARKRGFTVEQHNMTQFLTVEPPDGFHIVMTCGALCHVAPENWSSVRGVMAALSPEYIFCTEYVDGKEWDGFRHGRFDPRSFTPLGYELARQQDYTQGTGSSMTAVLIRKVDDADK